jgi:hypothetical protein
VLCVAGDILFFSFEKTRLFPLTTYTVRVNRPFLFFVFVLSPSFSLLTLFSIGFDQMYEKYEVVASSINSVIMVTSLPRMTLVKTSCTDSPPLWNYWQAEPILSMELNAHVPQLTEAENAFRAFESKIRELHFDEKEFSLLLLMIITRISKEKPF